MANSLSPYAKGDPGLAPNGNFADESPVALQAAPKNKFLYFGIAVVLVAAGTLGALLGVGVITTSDAQSGQEFTLSPTTTPPTQAVPSKFPTTFETPRPTLSPTAFPTPAPAADPTETPTFGPTSAPTRSPITDCIDPDAVCGCTQVQSQRLDIIFLVDESGSVGPESYDLMEDALVTFAQNAVPEVEPVDGMRLAYVEFAVSVNDELKLVDSTNAQNFVNFVRDTGFEEGGTDHRDAFLAAYNMLSANDPNAIREDSAIIVFMLTDGNPSRQGSAGVDVLRSLADDFGITFIFMPIVPGPGEDPIDETVFDDAIGQQGNSPGLIEGETFIRVPVASFDALSDVLNGGGIDIDLGPCVEAPTVSGGDIQLLLETERAGRGGGQVLL